MVMILILKRRTIQKFSNYFISIGSFLFIKLLIISFETSGNFQLIFHLSISTLKASNELKISTSPFFSSAMAISKPLIWWEFLYSRNSMNSKSSAKHDSGRVCNFFCNTARHIWTSCTLSIHIFLKISHLLQSPFKFPLPPIGIRAKIVI